MKSLVPFLDSKEQNSLVLSFRRKKLLEDATFEKLQGHVLRSHILSLCSTLTNGPSTYNNNSDTQTMICRMNEEPDAKEKVLIQECSWMSPTCHVCLNIQACPAFSCYMSSIPVHFCSILYSSLECPHA